MSRFLAEIIVQANSCLTAAVDVPIARIISPPSKPVLQNVAAMKDLPLPRGPVTIENVLSSSSQNAFFWLESIREVA
jgi:hypothetical protein